MTVIKGAILDNILYSNVVRIYLPNEPHLSMIFLLLILLHLFFPKQTTFNGGFYPTYILITHMSIYFYRRHD